MTASTYFFTRLAAQTAVLVSVHSVQGSAPREVGAWMAVFPDAQVGSVGGGHLEWQACAHARNLLLAAHQGGDLAPPTTMRYALGPSLGQCCGGVVHLRFEVVSAADLPALRQRLAEAAGPVALFGGGHVGVALVQVLGNLPFAVQWVDSRDGIFPAAVPANVQCEHADRVADAVADLPPGSRVLIMSFSHAEDFEVLTACLTRQRQRGDLPYIGLIGSRSKWQSFQHRLMARGVTEAELAHVTCPIGVPGIHGKAPEVIAVAVAAQLLQTLEPEAAAPATP